MTLNTSVYVLSEESPHEVFWKCRELLDVPTDLPWKDEPSFEGRWDLRNPGGVGLDAWLWLHYRPGEMLEPTAEPHDKWCEADCDGRHHPPPHWFEVTLDTAYGYRNEKGWSCGILHAALVAQLGDWLDSRGVRWAWQNEFTSEIHVGDRYEHLMDLMGEGEEAHRWFRDIVWPIIERMGCR